MKIGRFTIGNLVWLFTILLVLAALLYVELTHDTVQATVIGKRERIERNVTTAQWVRQPEARVLYMVDFRNYERWIALDIQTYDDTRLGAQIDVRYVSFNPDWARLASDSTLTALLQRTNLWQIFTWLVLAGGVVFAFRAQREWGLKRWWMLPRSLPRRLLVFGAVVLWVQIVAAGYFPPPQPAVSDIQRSGSAEARLRAVTTITQVGGGARETGNSLPIGLPQGFERLELVFIPDGWDDPVVAVDEVDVGSAGSLSSGMTVDINYAPDKPRDARILQGTRTHRWKNPLVIQGLIGLATVAVIGAPLAVRAYRGR